MTNKRGLQHQATQLPMQRAQHQKLFTWKLTPERGRFSGKWAHSSYRGTVFVRAQDALQARQLAAQRFSAGGELKDSPWVSRGLVIGVRVDEAAYERIDTVSIIYP